RIFLEDRRNAAAPRASEFFQQFLRGCYAAREIFLDRLKITSFVLTGAVETVTARQAFLRECNGGARELQHARSPDDGGKAELGHVIAQLLALRRRPVLDQNPGLIEGIVVIKD